MKKCKKKSFVKRIVYESNSEKRSQCLLFVSKTKEIKEIHVLGLDTASVRKASLITYFKASDLYRVDIYNGMT